MSGYRSKPLTFHHFLEAFQARCLSVRNRGVCATLNRRKAVGYEVLDTPKLRVAGCVEEGGANHPCRDAVHTVGLNGALVGVAEAGAGLVHGGEEGAVAVSFGETVITAL
ncbi:hypothetical protein C0Q70_19484 [Pomacea canaliculata]|uniref:Uncharacterized protein n=1 Tax=Pomacea canaliculata TaxID=400727 RepID=A0A2T7NJG8_POMCA|nr:hypothetical protein C0Q70_19484 [Pomacea canaliculata]